MVLDDMVGNVDGERDSCDEGITVRGNSRWLTSRPICWLDGCTDGDDNLVLRKCLVIRSSAKEVW